MSCSNRNLNIRSDYSRVEVMAQLTANLTGINQIIYETICSGRKIFTFSDNWKGTAIKTVYPVQLTGDNTSKDILRDTEEPEPRTTKQDKKSKRPGADKDLE